MSLEIIWKNRMKIFSVLSPTYLLAGILKETFNRTTVIKRLNSFYLAFSFISVIGLLVFQEYYSLGVINLNASMSFIIIFIWAYFVLSRCNEIFWAFLKDAFDKMDDLNVSNSTLSPSERIKLSLKSYLELIINFSILYMLLPKSCEVWGSRAPENIAEALYFSGVTITTLGYGDISPRHWWPQLLSVYEVFCGFILLIVCFAIYAGRLHNSPNKAG
ncbi:MAG: potassium channel family protein [Cocleimonas sp.]